MEKLYYHSIVILLSLSNLSHFILQMFSLLRHIVDKMMLIRNCIKQRLRNIIFAFSVIDPRSGEEKKSANIGIDKQKEVARLWLKVGDDYGHVNRMYTFVNCWHENETESEAMWKLYTAHQPEGVAIQTTYGALRKAIDQPEIQIGRITYENFDVAFMPGDSYGWYKRKSFEHEREVRVMIEPDDPEHLKQIEDAYKKKHQVRISLDVDIEALVERTYLYAFSVGMISLTPPLNASSNFIFPL